MESAASLSNLRQIRSFVSPDDSALLTLDAATIEQIGAAVLQRSDGSFVASSTDVAAIAAAAAAGLISHPSLSRDVHHNMQEVFQSSPPCCDLLRGITMSLLFTVSTLSDWRLDHWIP